MPHEVRAMLLPVRRRPFAHLRLPVPRQPWRFLNTLLSVPKSGVQGDGLPSLEARLPTTSGTLFVATVCHSQSQHTAGAHGKAVAMPCAALAAAFPMVLHRHIYGSTAQMLRELKP